MEPDCFLQGLVVLNSTHILISCGGYGNSRLIVYDIAGESGRVVFKAPDDVFLEGCTTIPDDRVIALSWREHKLFVFSLPSFQMIATHAYPHEGWGVTYDPVADLVYSTDGSSKIYRLDPNTFKEVGECDVKLSHDGTREIFE
jgi:glutamine cyclotransferase